MKFSDFGGTKGAGGSGQLFIKMKDGDRIQGVFRGDPKVQFVHWINSKPQKCTGKECALCADGDKARMRFKLNFLMRENGVWIAKIFDGSGRTYYDLKELHESDYNLEETVVNVTRNGDGTDTRYTIMPAKNNGGLTAKDFKALAAIPLNSLSDREADAEAAEAGDANEDDVPF